MPKAPWSLAAKWRSTWPGHIMLVIHQGRLRKPARLIFKSPGRSTTGNLHII